METIKSTGVPQWYAYLTREGPADNLRLIILMNVFFDRIEPELKVDRNSDTGKFYAADGYALPSVTSAFNADFILGSKWSNPAWDTHCSRLLSVANNKWGKDTSVYFLRNETSAFDATDGNGVRYRPNIECRFWMRRITDGSKPHYQIKGINIVARDPVRHRDVPASFLDMSSFRQMTYYAERTTIFSDTISERDITHEVGHMLGLSHVNYAKPSFNWKHPVASIKPYFSGNGPQEYGIDNAQQADRMGSGTLANPWHAFPWQKAMEKMTGTAWAQWIPSTSRIPPTVLTA